MSRTSFQGISKRGVAMAPTATPLCRIGRQGWEALRSQPSDLCYGAHPRTAERWLLATAHANGERDDIDEWAVLLWLIDFLMTDNAWRREVQQPLLLRVLRAFA
jgi:hypothetical protein